MKSIKRILCLCLCMVLLVLLMPMQSVEAAPSQAEVDEKIRWIIASIPDDCDTDYEKALWLHDYICKTVVYDLNVSGTSEAYGALLYGRASCGGYADAYKKLLRAVGIQCLEVIGGSEAGPHGWNMVILDGKCYFTDVCWDDIDMFNYISYGYFMLSFEEMEKNHYASSIINDAGYSFYLPEECNHTDRAYTYKDTGKPGSGHFNSSTTPEEVVQHFKVVKVNGSTVTMRCDFQFDGNADAWATANRVQIERLLGGYSNVYGGTNGYGVMIFQIETSFTPTQSIAFSQPTVYLNNSNMRQQLSVNFSPANASYQDVTYSSSDSRIAKVDENGVVRAVSSGTATITATAVDGKTATCQVVVDHQHNAIRAVAASAANCLNKGYKAHYICDSCGTRFSDSKGKNAISLMDVVIPTTSCITRIGKHNEEGHWIVCICGSWLTTRILPHDDWSGDGICDGEQCGYVMKPGATKPATKPTQPTTKPSQSTTKPATTPPATSGTSPATKPSVEVSSEPSVPITESIPVTEPDSAPSTEGTTLPGTTAPSVEAAQPEQTSILLWIVGGLIVVTAAILIICKLRKG